MRRKCLLPYLLAVCLFLSAGCSSAQPPPSSEAEPPAGSLHVFLEGGTRIPETGTPADLDSIGNKKTIRERMADMLSESSLPAGAYVSSEGIYFADASSGSVDYNTATCWLPVVCQGSVLAVFGITADPYRGQVIRLYDRPEEFRSPAEKEPPDRFWTVWTDALTEDPGKRFAAVEYGWSRFLISEEGEILFDFGWPYTELTVTEQERLFERFCAERTVISYADIAQENAWLVKK